MRILCFLFAAIGLSASEKYLEEKYPSWGQFFEVEKVVCSQKTDFVDVSIFENPTFGKVLVIDGMVQKTEKDEHIFHEMLVHPALIAHGKPVFVLILGGSDGGALREVLRHKDVQRVVLVEKDVQRMNFVKKHMPSIAQGAFEDPRVEIVELDFSEYLKGAQLDVFDIILCDEPYKEEGLYTKEFFADCKNRLSAGGIFVHPNGVPFFQKEEIKTSIKNRKPSFDNVTFYTTAIPTSLGGIMAFAWSSDVKHNAPLETLKKRLGKVTGKLKYFNPAIFKAAFALPAFLTPQEKPAKKEKSPDKK